MHDLSVITTIAAAFTAAWLLGLLTQRLGLSPIVGYILGGVLIGPHTPGFVGDLNIAKQLAEVGVILLMFGVGMHFHVKDLLAVKGVAIPGAVVQSLVATLAAVLVFTSLGLPVRNSVVLGMAMAVASTVVLMRVLTDADALSSPQGHVAVGWLLVEDIFTVVVLVLIPVLGSSAGANGLPAGGAQLWPNLAAVLLKLAALVGIVVVAGSRVIPWVLLQVARLRSRELFTLTVLVFSIATATGAYFLFGTSMALGAFLAGMLVALSPVSYQAAADALPLRDAFAVLFFVSVGMLFDPTYIAREPLLVLGALGVILIAKPLAALFIVAVLGHSVSTALTVAVGLAQIGEFSFILSDVARHHRLLADAGHNVLVAAAIISIALNPILFRTIAPIEAFLRARPRLWRLLNGRAERRARERNRTTSERIGRDLDAGEPLAIVVGFGPVGRAVNRLLQDAPLATVVVDLNLDTVSALSASGQAALYGDASHETILEQAGVRRATHLISTLPSAPYAVVSAAKRLNPDVRVLARARYLRERDDLERVGVAAAVFEEAEAAVALSRLVLADTGVHRQAAEEKVRDLRLQLVRENLSNIRTQHVRSIMVPWSRVQWLPPSADKSQVLRRVSEERFSRWPVLDPETRKASGYLLAKDLIAEASAGNDWTDLIRPLHTVHTDDDIESTLARMQEDGATIYVVEGSAGPAGLITLEDILEQVVGRIEDEYPHDAELSLADAVSAGGVVLDLLGGTPEQVIRELASAIRASQLPAGVDVAELALARESAVSTDIGVGVAVPHARCPRLRGPLVVLGRSNEGVIFSSESRELVRLVFLLLTPSGRPELQLSLLAKVAAIAKDSTARERLLRASSPPEVLEILAHGAPRGEQAAREPQESPR